MGGAEVIAGGVGTPRSAQGAHLLSALRFNEVFSGLQSPLWLQILFRLLGTLELQTVFQFKNFGVYKVFPRL